MLKHILIVTSLLALSSHVYAQDEAWTDDEVAAARHCVSEASGATRSNDCRVIIWIDREQARRRGVTVAAFIAEHYVRHTRGDGSRPWIAGLDATMTRPAGWDESVLPWETRGLPAWRATLSFVREHWRNDASHGCDGVPLTWGGRMDIEGVNAWIARGYEVLSCGRTLNTFIGRRRRR